ncbi:branched-chain amino acid ABC transporter permease [Microcella sp.]|uniref:branched-chain amino acid ABC transporter permease n=1 Tax=Microcella sp. TaxID=1913979 RepID=UPI002569B8A1|nr:branched-chain amino acid ABC transporter permease [Microcella sp.]MBX9472377.1 branched-chain amino acid ABC transporter permease [Microcella sp.]
MTMNKQTGAPPSQFSIPGIRPYSTRERVIRWAGVPAVIVAFFFLPVALGGGIRIYDTLVVIAIFALMVYGVDMLLSYLGDISLGHTAFWAAGAYVTAASATRFGWNSWMTLVASIVLCLALAAVLGGAVYKSRAFIFTLSTYAAAVVLSNIAHNWEFVGGSDGVVGVPFLDLSIGPIQIATNSVQDMWPVVYVVLVLVILGISRFRHSKLARTSLMAYMNPDLATTMGVNVSRARFLLLVISSVPPALAGWLYAYYRSYVSPDLFEMYFLIIMLTAAAIVGRRVLLGPVIGVALIITQQNLFSLGGSVDKLILGLVLVVVLTVWPSGLLGLWHLLRDTGKRLLARRHRV